jgi:hypothetical protein
LQTQVLVTWRLSLETQAIVGATYELLDYEGPLKSMLKGSQIGYRYGWRQISNRLSELTCAHSQSAAATKPRGTRQATTDWQILYNGMWLAAQRQAQQHMDLARAAAEQQEVRITVIGDRQRETDERPDSEPFPIADHGNSLARQPDAIATPVTASSPLPYGPTRGRSPRGR